MRGKGIADDEARAAVGITPRVRGKAKKKVPFLPPHQDHPRVCGEKARSICRPLCKMGSPPRMRGKSFGSFCFLSFRQDHPRVCGKSRRLSHCRSQFWDHPRVCGEKVELVHQTEGKVGITPRVRGKVHISTGQVGGVGITPAYAGKRAVANFRPGTIRDHPRVCGEKTCLIMSSRFWMGSPPRMRGKVYVGVDGQARLRITPAYAGKKVKVPLSLVF